MKKVVLIHGWEGSPEREWFPWAKTELEKKGLEVICPYLPNPEHPNLAAWLHEIQRMVGVIDKETIFVGHSLGCVTVLQFLIKVVPEKIHIAGAVFIAGFSGHFSEPQIKDFYAPEEKVVEVSKRIGKSFVFYSDNDDWVTPEKADHFASLLGARKIFVEGKGHFSEDDKVFELPQLVDVVLSI